MIIICPEGSRFASENVRECVWIIAFLKQSMALSETAKRRQSHTTHQPLIACWQQRTLGASLFLSSLLSEPLPSTLKFIEFIWTRTRMKLAKRRQGNRVKTFIAATFITPFLFAKWNFDLWIVISGSFMTRFALFYFFGAKQDCFCKLYDGHQTHFGWKIARYVVYEILSWSRAQQRDSYTDKNAIVAMFVLPCMLSRPFREKRKTKKFLMRL